MTDSTPNDLPEPEGSQTHGGTGPLGTTTSDWRWKGLSTLVALTITYAYISVIAIRLLAPAFGYEVGAVDNGDWAVLTTAFVVGMGYTLGVDTYREMVEIRNGSGGEES